jgi:hypothetical protein
VPRSENSAWFWLIGSTCPLHIAQPLGANWKLVMRISARNGSMAILCGRVEPFDPVIRIKSPAPGRHHPQDEVRRRCRSIT